MTIPQHLIDKGARAMHFAELDADDLEQFEDTPHWYQVIVENKARAALAAVAADIWEEGSNDTLDWDDALREFFENGGTPPGDLTNPYAQETA